MRRGLLLGVAMIAVAGLVPAVQAESTYRLGMGANIDTDGLSWMVSYQYNAAALLKLEADLEVFPESFQGVDHAAYAPEFCVVFGSTVYGAAGAGIVYSDGGFENNPFGILRAGLEYEIISLLYLDINVNYRFAEASHASGTSKPESEDILMLGMAVRYGF